MTKDEIKKVLEELNFILSIPRLPKFAKNAVIGLIKYIQYKTNL